jgi:hypothetical protein
MSYDAPERDAGWVGWVRRAKGGAWEPVVVSPSRPGAGLPEGPIT